MIIIILTTFASIRNISVRVRQNFLFLDLENGVPHTPKPLQRVLKTEISKLLPFHDKIQLYHLKQLSWFLYGVILCLKPKQRDETNCACYGK